MSFVSLKTVRDRVKMLLTNGVGSNTKYMSRWVPKNLFHFRIQSDTHHSEAKLIFIIKLEGLPQLNFTSQLQNPPVSRQNRTPILMRKKIGITRILTKTSNRSSTKTVMSIGCICTVVSWQLTLVNAYVTATCIHEALVQINTSFSLEAFLCPGHIMFYILRKLIQ